MPRNSSGVYALPAGNPVVSETLIETTWANPTLADIAQALTDSLDRNGRGTMLAPMKFADGTAAAPGVAFAAESSSGMYRAGAKAIAFSVFGSPVMQFTDQTVTLMKPAGFADGTAAAPSIAFSSEATSGIFRQAAKTLGVAANGAQVAYFSDTELGVLNRVLVKPAASAATFIAQAAAGNSASIALAGNGSTPWGAGSLELTADNTGNALLWNHANTPLLFGTNGTETMRLTANGLLGIGAAAPAQLIHGKRAMAVIRMEATGAIGTAGTQAGLELADSTGTSGYIGFSSGDSRMLFISYTNKPFDFWTPTAGDLFTIDPAGFVVAPMYQIGTDANCQLYSNNISGTWHRGFNYSSGNNIEWRSSDNAYIFNQGGTTTMLMNAGNLYWQQGTCYKPGGGPWADLSDSGIKQNVRDYLTGLTEIIQLRPRVYNFTNETGRDTTVDYVGLIAQEAQPIMPEMVGTAGEFLTLDTNALQYALVNSVRELTEAIEAMDVRLTNLEGAIA